jgi:hypothetical protein
MRNDQGVAATGTTGKLIYKIIFHDYAPSVNQASMPHISYP